MRKGAQTRARIITAATELIQQQGYAATGIKQILEQADAPRGSFYFHFPDGKDELAVCVIEAHARDFLLALQPAIIETNSPLAALQAALDLLAVRLQQSHCAAGCPVTSLALEMANQSPTIQQATQLAYQSWIDAITQILQPLQMTPQQARATASALLSAIEGALILCRAYQSTQPLDDLAAQLPHLLPSTPTDT